VKKTDEFYNKFEEAFISWAVDKNFLFVSWSIFSRLLYVKKIWTTRYRRWMIETDRRCITHIIFL